MKDTTDINVRLWDNPHSKPVKLTLRPGQSLRWGQHITGNGRFSSEAVEWEYDETLGEVVRRRDSHGKDGGMRWTRREERYIRLGDLPKPESGEVVYPTWTLRWREDWDEPRRSASNPHQWETHQECLTMSG